MALDLKQPAAIEIAKRLVAHSDIVCENFAAGVMDRLGLGYTALRKVNPEIIMIALSGYGLDGPESEFVSYGPAQVPLSGLSSLTGYAGWPPMHVGISYGDPTAGLHGAVAVLAALLHRHRTGKGQFIDLSQMESMIALLPEGVMDFAMNQTQPPRNGNRDPTMAPHGVFRCRGDQRWVAIAVRDEQEWKRFVEAIGMPAVAEDPRFHDLKSRKANEDALEEIVTMWTAQQSDTDVVQVLQAHGIPSSASFNSRDLAEDPHLRESGLFVAMEHPEVGQQMHVGMPWRMSGTPTAVNKAAPCLGENTDAIMQLLGYSEEEIAHFRSERILY